MKLLRPDEVAAMLNCSVSKVYELKRRIRHCKIDGMVRFRVEDVEDFIRNCVVEVRLEPRRAPRSHLKHITI